MEEIIINFKSIVMSKKKSDDTSVAVIQNDIDYIKSNLDKINQKIDSLSEKFLSKEEYNELKSRIREEHARFITKEAFEPYRKTFFIMGGAVILIITNYLFKDIIHLP